MVSPTDTVTLVGQIESQDSSAVASLAALPDRRLVDPSNRTLLDVAIRADNRDVITFLASDADALEFSAAVDAELADPIRHATAMQGIEVPICRLEAILEKSFGSGLSYGRTPLHTACRIGNAMAIEALLQAGAKTSTKDAIGLTAPELAFYADGEDGLRGFVAAFKRSGQQGLPLGKGLLGEAFSCPEAMTELLEVARPDAHALRLLFCYRCAWLDTDAVRSMLAEGYEPNKGLTAEINPLWQACTSALLWDETIPGGFEMSYHLTKYLGHPGASSVSFDSALLNEDGSNFGELMAEAQRKKRAQVERVNAMTINPDTERDVIARRIALLDILLEAGADLSLARKKLKLATFADLREMGLGEVADRLKRRGKAAQSPPKTTKPAAATSWELVGETGLNAEYWPKNTSGGLVRLILHNVYGPVDGVALSARVSRDPAEPDSEWQELRALSESVVVNGQTMSRADLKEPVYGESPWEAIYELPINKAAGAKMLRLRLDHEDETLCGELDPWVFG